MKRLLLAAILGLTTLAANATCPTTISGKYSGSGQYTEQDFVNNVAVISYVEYHIVSVVFSGNSMTVVKEYYAATGTGTPAVQEAVGVVPFTFDKTTCMGQMGSNTDPMYYTVSDSGNTIKVIHGKAPNSKYLYAEQWELNKQ
jgi:hypothetical protein